MSLVYADRGRMVEERSRAWRRAQVAKLVAVAKQLEAEEVCVGRGLYMQPPALRLALRDRAADVAAILMRDQEDVA